MAVLGAKLDAMHVDLQAYCARQDAHEARLRQVEREQTRLKARQEMYFGGNVIASAVGSVIAAIIGVKAP